MTTPLPPILYVTPHADDEILSMVCSIREELRAGRQVHVLLLTTGENSGARAHYPELSTAAFVEARDDEYVRACRRIGVPFHNIHIGDIVSGYRPADGLLTQQAIQDMVSGWIAELRTDEMPDVHVKTLTWRSYPGRHADHIACGYGVWNLQLSGAIPVNGLRCLIEPYGLDAFRAANPGVNIGSIGPGADLGVIQAAIDQYRWRDSAGSMYGVGYDSVKSYFDALRPAPVSYWHVP